MKTTEKKYKSLKAGVITILIATIFIGQNLVSSAGVQQQGLASQQQIINVQYFEYENTVFNYRAEIISDAEATITLREIYYYENEEYFSYISSYDKNTRRMLDPNPDDYYLWIWINEKDLNSGPVHAGNKTLTLIDTTPDFYVLVYSDPSGSGGTLYYSRNSRILQMTYDTVIIDGEPFYSSTVLIATGIEGSGVPAQNLECYILQYDTNPEGQPLRGTTYQPPYCAKGGDKYSRAEWRCIASASWAANHIIGRHYNYGEVNSGPHIQGLLPLGRGIAQAWAWVMGPSGGSFSCSQSGTYRIEMIVRLYGATQVSIVNAGWLGSGYACGKNILTGYLYDYGTGYLAGSSARTLFEGSAVPSNWRIWNNEMTTISFNVNLYAGHSYYFKTQLFAELKAGHIFAGAGYALTGLEAMLLSVTVTRL